MSYAIGANRETRHAHDEEVAHLPHCGAWYSARVILRPMRALPPLIYLVFKHLTNDYEVIYLAFFPVIKLPATYLLSELQLLNAEVNSNF